MSKQYFLSDNSNNFITTGYVEGDSGLKVTTVFSVDNTGLTNGYFFTSQTGFNVPGNLFYVDDTGAMLTHDLEVTTTINVGGDIDTSANINADNLITALGGFITGGGAIGSGGAGLVVLGNAAVQPSTSVDAAQLYAKDISAGHATLGIYTEQAIAADVSLVSTSSLTIFINGAKYKIPLVFVP